MKKLNPMVLALALAFPIAAHAQSNAELKKEIDELKAQIAEMKRMIGVKPAAAPAAAVDPAEFNRIRVKVEAMEDQKEASGFKDLKVSGFMDPVYMYNQATGRGAFQFMNDISGGSINDLTTDIYAYNTSNLGGATIKFEKDFGDGTMVVALRPHKGSDTIFETAMLNVPLDNGFTLMAGKTPSFNGYELADAPVNKSLTHNLLFDFGGPSYITGAGLKFDLGGFAWQTMIGNLNSRHDLPGSKSSGFHWRGDYELSEFNGWAINGMHGNLYGNRYNFWELDYWFTKGDLTMNAQVETSSHKNGNFDYTRDTAHFGLSGLVAYKLAPQWELVARADWIDNHKNGGGGPAFYMGADDGTQGPGVGCPDDGSGAAFAAACGDYRNGFGPGAVFNDTTGFWELGDTNRGAKRTALSFGLNYTLNESAMIKFEYRHDRSDLNSFYQLSDGSYKKTNNTFGVQTVVKF
jgi:hypothetical protein